MPPSNPDRRTLAGVPTLVLILALLAPGALHALQAPAQAPPQSPPQGAVQALDSLGRAVVESGRSVGLGLGVFLGGEPVLSAGFGWADLENDVSVTDSTVFRIGSVTKQFTAAAILRLVEEGALSLDDDLTRFLPEYPVGDRRITLHQLLNHTSGIRSYTALGAPWMSGITLDRSHEEMLALFQDEPFDFEPGEGFAYNNSGYYLLGIVIEKATGRAYDEFLQEAFFEPLGLRDTSYCWERPILPRRARGYQPGPDGVRNADPLSMTQPYAAGALCSSVRDLAAWDRALRSGEVVSPDSYLRMTTPEGLPGGAPMQYGYGLVTGAFEGHPVVEHGGGINGFNALLTHYPEADLTIVSLVNLNGPAANQTAQEAARIMLGIDSDEVADLPLTADERARYVGHYAIEILPTTIFEEGEQLMAQGEGQPPFPLLFQGEVDGAHEFRAAVDPAIRFVFTLEEGRAVALTVHQAGMQFRGVRER
ncbi:MAG: class A beta-lactamase-related serine hydrolase [Gemmatimonadales bacterium]|nr:MAG: class A beta-lactamase-related serine hydrolase [Gemmatimonadales bacterium]